jgi:hypothetical protein
VKTKSIIIGLFLSVSTLLFGVPAIASANTSNINSAVQEYTTEIRVEIVCINGVLWSIVYDADENIVQASAIGHAG